MKLSNCFSMMGNTYWISLLFTLLMFVNINKCLCNNNEDHLDRNSFPEDFVFGVAGSSYQYEGGAKADGRGPSIWDTFCHTSEETNIFDGSSGDVATDSYHRYKEDVQLVKELGMDSYRVSISWSRVLPKGTLEGGINKDGVRYYNNLFNEMVKHGIKPFVTLFHWDLPQALEENYKGFLNQRIIKDFGDYAELCFKEFGDRVKHWITLNEPLTYAKEGYTLGTKAPGRCSPYFRNCAAGDSSTEPYIVTHNMILAHANAVNIYKTKYQGAQKGLIGITLNSDWLVPYSDKVEDIEAAKRGIDFQYGWYLDPIVKGKYPKSMRQLVRNRLPKFTKDQIKVVNGSYDFVGINYYTANFASNIQKPIDPSRTDYLTDQLVKRIVERSGILIGEKAASNWLYVYPNGIKELLLHTKKEYGNPPIYITENGVDEWNIKGLDLKEALNDEMRVRYHSQHIKAMRDAIKEGADVRGYFAWSLLDNFEWENGYSVRFGLYYVDFDNGSLDRHPKSSVKWFQDFLGAPSTSSLPSQQWNIQ